MLNLSRHDRLFVFILLITASCTYLDKYKSKVIVDVKLDIIYTTQFQSCDVKKLPEEDKVFYEPFEIGDSIARIDGKIFQTGISDVAFVSISPSNYNSLITKREQMMNDKETVEASLLNFRKMIDEINIEPLCGGSKTTQDFGAVNKIINENKYQDVFVLSKNISDSTWNSYLVYKDPSDLKQKLKAIYKANNQSSILIIVDPENAVDSTTSGIVAEPIKEVSNIQDNEQIRQLLLKTNSLHSLDFSQRKIEVDKITDSYFADSFTINVSFSGGNSLVSKKVDVGRDYLDQLASNNHLVDVKVNGFKKDSKGKITEVSVTEIQKSDIDVKTK